MADFVAVLRKTIGALGSNTPEMREKVYEKARATIEAKLAAINPPPPQGVADRQRKALEDAIKVMRAEFDKPAKGAVDDDLEDVFATLSSAQLAKPAPAPAPVQRAPLAPVGPVQPRTDTPHEETAPDAPFPAWKTTDPATDPDLAPTDEPPARMAAPTRRRARRRPSKRLIAAVVGLLAVFGLGYVVWANQSDFERLADDIADMFATDSSEVATQTPPPAPEASDAQPAQQAEAEPEAPAEEDVAAAQPGDTPDDAADAPRAEPDPELEKFTQRLMPDGTEVDAGRAGGEPTIGEGTSVAALASAQEAEAAPDEPPADQQGEAASPTVAVGQRAIFYEEGTSSAQGSAEMGSIVWSLVEESPGSEQPTERAIRAEATIPENDLQLRLTIRRNDDQTLPASHIVEMIFLTPEGFEGGAIESVSRISLKENEQATGSPLLGIPAKIADGFFLLALSNSPAELEANMTLLRRQSWIDIPLVYQSGRRALITLEKGIPGDRVFQEALAAWQASPEGAGGEASGG